jgi:hypothetical protein
VGGGPIGTLVSTGSHCSASGRPFRQPCGADGDECRRVWYKSAMAANNLEQLIERVRRWPKQRQDDAAEVLLEMERQDTSGYGLSDAQVQEVTGIQLEVREGTAAFATDEQMAALWKSCGL